MSPTTRASTAARRSAPSSEGRSAADFIPPRPSLPKLRAAAARCPGCHLWRLGTQTVFGEGPAGATVMFVGEQPGDNDREIAACRPWLEMEIKLVKPRVIVCLGATAAQALLGKQFRVTRDRGKPIRPAAADGAALGGRDGAPVGGDPLSEPRRPQTRGSRVHG